MILSWSHPKSTRDRQRNRYCRFPRVVPVLRSLASRFTAILALQCLAWRIFQGQAFYHFVEGSWDSKSALFEVETSAIQPYFIEK